jgi:crotonobetainyl-CoA:carnitine CoA-transferase CaiB-like acyl-CoA transferase
MAVLEGFRAVQVGPGLAAAVCGRLLADVGADVVRVDPDRSTPLAGYLNHGASSNGTLEAADLIIGEGSPATLARAGHDAETLRRRNPSAAIVLISPFGQTGPRAEEPATDLTLFFASGIARMLTGQVDDLDEAPMSPVGQQSAFIGGIAAACAGMHAALLGNGAVVDVSIHEALATLATTELARAGQTRKSWSRERVGDGNGATVCILPASDGYAAISPREDRPMGGLAGGDGLARVGPGTSFRHQEGARRQLGRAARTHGSLEPRQAQTLDRRGCSGRPRS